MNEIISAWRKTKIQQCFMVLSLLSILSSCSTIPNGYTKISNAPDEKFYKYYDQFTDATSINHEYRLLNLLDCMSVHIIKHGGSSRLIANFYYSDPDWIFFDSAILVNNRSERMQIKMQKTDHKVRTGYVTESGKSVLQQYEIDSLRSIMTGENVLLRLTGKYSKEYSITQEQASSIVETIDLFTQGDF